MSFDRLPPELKLVRQWILWRYEETDSGKPTKVPYQPNGHHASTTDPSTWSSFDEVVAASPGFSGIGFVFTAADPYAGIDLDTPKNPDGSSVSPDEFAKIRDRQIKVFQQFDSYTEYSPSGEGLHIIIRAALPMGRKRSSIEMYSSGRFFTMTGRVYHDVPIADRQGLAEVLFNQMGGGTVAYQYDGEQEQKATDEEIVQRALDAVNGEKFGLLLSGAWKDLYPSQSEADFAFIDIVAFYTQNRKQIRRIFRGSPLGVRDKAKRDDYLNWMINKSFDRMLPPLDLDGLYNAREEYIATHKDSPQELPVVESIRPPPELPRGLMGEIASFVYAAAPVAVHEIAIAAAIGFMSGICGRSWNVNGSGLNMYTLMLASTGRGKEAMSSGINRLVAALGSMSPGTGVTVPSISHFIGPGEIASGQALSKSLSNQPCFVSIIGEFGLRMASLASDKASANDLMLKRALLQLYSQSGASGAFQGSTYADKDKNVGRISMPAFSILCESTPETFYSILDESLISDGLLPRFLTLYYDGHRPYLNEAAYKVMPTFELTEKLGSLVVHAHALNGTGQPAIVGFSPRAYELQMDFSKFTTDKINAAQNRVTAELWNRAHLKLIRLSALIAVGADPHNPVIQEQDIAWAYKLISRDVERVIHRFDTGEVGRDQETSVTRQQNDMYRVLIDYSKKKAVDLQRYGVNADAHSVGFVPHSYISRRLASIASYRKDRLGATGALKRTINELIEFGVIKKVPASQVTAILKETGTYYAVMNFQWTTEA